LIPRIVFVLPSFAGGGAERVIINYLRHLDRSRLQPILIVLNGKGPLSYLVPDDVTVLDLETPRLRAGLKGLVGGLRAARPAAIVSTFGHINAPLLALRPFLKGRPKLIIREANTPSQSLPTTPSPALFRWLYRRYYRRADAVLCNAAPMADELHRAFGVPLHKIVRLNNPVDVNVIRTFADIPLRAQGDGPRFVAAGRLTAQKGFDRLIDMFAKMPRNCQLSIIGDGPDRQALEAKINSLDNGSQRIRLEGFTGEPWSRIGGADGFLLPSRWEGMPNAALEALACGTRVIATPEAGGIAELAAAAGGNAVTIAEAGEPFIKAMMTVEEDPRAEPRPSLLPAAFDAPDVTRQLEDLILEQIQS